MIERDELGRILPGQEGLPGAGAPTGNQNRAKAYRIKRMLEKILDEASTKAEGVTRLEMACRAQIDKAEEGDTVAFREVADRVEGKAQQSIDAQVNGNLAMILGSISKPDDPPLEG